MKIWVFVSLLMTMQSIMYASGELISYANRAILNSQYTRISIKNSLDLAIKIKMINHIVLSQNLKDPDMISTTGVNVTWDHKTKWITIRPSKEVQFDVQFGLAGLSDKARGRKNVFGEPYIDQTCKNVLLIRTADKKLRTQKRNVRMTIDIDQNYIDDHSLPLVIGLYNDPRCVKVGYEANPEHYCMSSITW